MVYQNEKKDSIQTLSDRPQNIWVIDLSTKDNYLDRNRNMSKIAERVYIADGAKILGDVTIGSGSSVWYNAVIRGDASPIVIGEKTNIQDNAVLHVGHEQSLRIGNNVTIGHGAIVHGCAIGNNVLIGMGAIVLDGAVIEDNCILGAGALITQNKKIEEGSLCFGNPAKVMRQITEEEKISIQKNADNYAEEAAEFFEKRPV